MKTIEEIKNEVSVKHGYESFYFMLLHMYAGESKPIDVSDIISEAMQEYAKQCCEEQKNACAENAEIKTISECVVNSDEGYFDGYRVIVDKESILNTPNVVK